MTKNMTKKLITAFLIFSTTVPFLALLLLFDNRGTQAAPRHPATPLVHPSFSTWLPLTLLPRWHYTGEAIAFWNPYSGQRWYTIRQLVENFNDTNPWTVEIESQYQGHYDDIHQRMLAAIHSGDVPGLVSSYANQAATYQLLGALVDIDEYVHHPEWGLSQEELDDFFPSILQADVSEQFGGMRLGFPTERSIEIMYYNLDWLKELGYDGPPQTWDEFQEMACQATHHRFSGGPNDESPIGYEVSTDASRFASMVFSRGGDLMNEEMTAYTLNTPQSREAMMLMQHLWQVGCAGPIAYRYGDQDDFASGKLLFTFSSSSNLPYYKSAVADGAQFNWSVAALPHTTSDPVVNTYGASVSIPKTTPEEQLGAWLFLKWWSQPEQQAEWAKVTNYFPVRKSAAAAMQDYFAQNPNYAKAFNLLPYGKTEPPVACYGTVRTKISAAYSAILNGANVETTLAQLEQESNETLVNCQP